MPTNNDGDPFARLTQIGSEEAERDRELEEELRLRRERELAAAQAAVDAKPAPAVDEPVESTKNAREMAKKSSKFVIPLSVIALVGFVVISPDPGQVPVAAQKPGEVNSSQQTAAYQSMWDTLQSDARKKEAAKVNPPLPGQGALPLPVPSTAQMPVPTGMPQGNTGAADAERAKKEAELAQREAEIRASPLESPGQVMTLIADPARVPDPSAPVSTRQANARAEANEYATRVNANGGAASAGGFGGSNAMGYAAAGSGMAGANGLSSNGYGVNGDFGNGGAPSGPARSGNQDFMAEQQSASNEAIQVLRQQHATGQYIVNQGTPIQAVLLSGITSDLPGTVTAMVTYDVYDSLGQGAVLIPKGSKLVGKYNSQVIPGQSRLLIAMNRMILPNGTWISLAGANGTDPVGQSGLEAEVNNHFFKIFGTSLILGAASYLLPSGDRNITSTIGGLGGVQAGGSIAGQALNDSVKAMLERNKKIDPTLSKEPGMEFMFMAAHDMALTPYRR